MAGLVVHFSSAFCALVALLAALGAHGLVGATLCGAHGLTGVALAGGLGAHGLVCALAMAMPLDGPAAAGKGARAANAKVSADNWQAKATGWRVRVFFIIHVLM